MARSRNTADTQTASGGPVSPSIAGKNAIINGGFDIWQRGTSFTAADVYTSDRWKNSTQTYSTISRQATSDTTNLPTIQYCARISRNSGQTGTAALGIIYNVETADSIKFAGQSVVVSFWARAGANYSSASSVLNYNFYTGTGTDQGRTFGVQFTGEANIASSSKTLTTTWQRFSFTATVGATVTGLALMFLFNGVGTAGAADYFEITGVQLELGSVATPFSRAGGTIQGELAACQRYYWRSTNTDLYAVQGIGIASATTAIGAAIQLPVVMRVKPTSIDYTSLQFSDTTTSPVPSSLTLSSFKSSSSIIYVDGAGITGATAFRVYELRNNNSASGYIGASAEL